MKIKKFGAAIACILFLSACGTSGNTADNAVTEGSFTETSEILLSGKTEKNDVPEIYDNFSGSEPLCTKRGSALLKLVDDEAAADGKALKIYNRNEAWNGADFAAAFYGGNDIEVSGAHRSANPAVRVSVQFTVCGNTSYNMIFSVNTSQDAYASGSGTFSVPSNAENILIYIESDNLEDIYADEFSVKVSGEYKYYAEAEGIAFVDTSGYPSLKEAYGDMFRIGVAISPTIVEKTEYSQLVKAQFNSVTLENDMKPEAIFDHNKTVADKEKYMECPALRFNGLKEELDFAKDNGMTVRGHTLVWHSQTPDWIFYKDYVVGGELADRELMLKRMENYIRSVMEWTEENYPGLVSAWDVVNEAAADEGGMRKSLWYQTIGEDYISKAFEFARKYAPENVKLFYNDYNSYLPGKQKVILEFLRPVAEAGNIDGVGMQTHINTDISQPLYMAALKKYCSELGVEIHVTELDIGTNKAGDYEKVQGDYYKGFMERLIKLKDEGVPITSVTLWGLTDSLSWKASDKPLVFNDDLSRKPAFDGMIEAAYEHSEK